MVGKTPLILAPLIVGLAVLVLAFLAGRWWERAGRRYASSFIDPKTHADLVEVVRRILAPSVNAEEICLLPASVATDAQKVLATADEQAAKRRREELRRRGW